MRPSLDTSKLFSSQASPASERRDTENVSAQPTVRAPASDESGIRSCFAEAARAEPRRPALAELDSMLGARVLRLEIVLGACDAALVADARVLRAALADAAAHASVSPRDGIDETLGCVYTWAFGALDAIFLGEYVRPLPRRMVRSLRDHALLTGMASRLDPALAALEAALRAVIEATTRVGR